jgi:hypothetical protein
MAEAYLTERRMKPPPTRGVVEQRINAAQVREGTFVAK